MIRYGETIHSMLPQDIPWFLPDHAIFFGVLYAVLGVLGLGLTYVVVKSVRQTSCGCSDKH
ncbi:MAG: hypothetical protein LBR82_02640 [Desulfovibrio sp.]|jgi:hypothetical protein|nr:hypothetical protein [Desulfovibrio sp.]